jgi:hypothetical protein
MSYEEIWIPVQNIINNIFRMQVSLKDMGNDDLRFMIWAK